MIFSVDMFLRNLDSAFFFLAIASLHSSSNQGFVMFDPLALVLGIVSSIIVCKIQVNKIIGSGSESILVLIFLIQRNANFSQSALLNFHLGKVVAFRF